MSECRACAPARGGAERRGAAPAHRVRLGGNGELDLLVGASIGSGTVLAGDGGDGASHLDVAGLDPHISRVSFTVERSDAAVRSVRGSRPGTSATAAARIAASCRDPTRNTAVGPPWRITQSSTSSAERKSRHPCSLMGSTLSPFLRADLVGLANLEAADPHEVADVSGHQCEPMLEGSGRDERVGKPPRRASSQSTSALGDCRIDGEVRHRLHQPANAALLAPSSREQLGSCDGRHMELVAADNQASMAAQVINEHVTINEDPCHGPTRRDSEARDPAASRRSR